MKNAGINENGKALNTIKRLVKFKTLGENILKGDKMTGLIGLKTWKVLFLRKNTLIGKETSSSYFQTVWGFKDRYLRRNNFTFFFSWLFVVIGQENIMKLPYNDLWTFNIYSRIFIKFYCAKSSVSKAIIIWLFFKLHKRI